MAGGRYKVACNPLGTVSNAPLASVPGKELRTPILSMLEIHRGQVNRIVCVIDRMSKIVVI